MHPYIMRKVGKLDIDSFEGLVEVECIVNGLFDEPSIFPNHDMIEALLVDTFWFNKRFIVPKREHMQFAYKSRIVRQLLLGRFKIVVNLLSKQGGTRL